MEWTDFGTIRSSDIPLAERVATQISELIVERHLTSEDKLPNEFELASMLNVGRGTIREAVKILVARNVLVIRRGKGTYIASHPGEIEDPLGFAYYDNQLQLAKDLLEVRLQMEPWVTKIASERATKEDIEKMWEKCHLVEEDILAGRNHLPNDTRFHTSIAECTHNMVVPKLIPIITYSVGLFGSITGNSLRTETIIDHRAVAEAIGARDGERAAASMRQHLLANKKELDAIEKDMNERGE